MYFHGRVARLAYGGPRRGRGGGRAHRRRRSRDGITVLLMDNHGVLVVGRVGGRRLAPALLPRARLPGAGARAVDRLAAAAGAGGASREHTAAQFRGVGGPGRAVRRGATRARSRQSRLRPLSRPRPALMRTVVVDDYEALSRAAADAIAATARAPARCAAAAGHGRHADGRLPRAGRAARRAASSTPRRLRAAQLDEYAGLAADDRRSLYGWMVSSFLEPLDVPARAARSGSTPGSRPTSPAAHYDAAVAAGGGFDLAVLGLGPNGHLGFNEPPIERDAPTRLVPLTPASVRSNARYWGDEDNVPREALTCGLASMLEAREILLVVSGAHKREILQPARWHRRPRPTCPRPGCRRRPATSSCSPTGTRCLLLDRACQDAADEVALQHQVDDHDRQRRRAPRRPRPSSDRPRAATPAKNERPSGAVVLSEPASSTRASRNSFQV